MTKFKRLLSVLVCAAMASAVLPVPAAETYTSAASGEFGGHTYSVYENAMTWSAAKAYCEGLGGHLLTITSAEEQAFVESLLAECKDTDYFIGLHEDIDDFGTWVTGETLEYSNWGNNEPDNYRGKQDAGAIVNGTRNGSGYYVTKWQWDDITGSESYAFICEWDKAAVTLDQTEASLAEGDTLTLAADTAVPNQTMIWSSSDESVATVDENGEVTAISEGTATITVTTEDGSKTATCTVTVEKKTTHLYKLFDEAMTWHEAKTYCESLGGHLVTITSQEEQDEMIEMLSAGTKNVYWIGLTDEETEGTWKWVTGEEFVYSNWEGTNPDNARGAEDYVEMYANEKYTVGAWNDDADSGTASDGNNSSFHALANHGFICEWDSVTVTLDKTEVSLTESDTLTLTADTTPSNQTMIWTSSDESVATVDENGEVTAVSEGTATITVTTEDGSYSATCTVTVTANTISVTDVTLNKTSLSLTEGNSETLTATVAPTNATNQSVSWTSSDESVATVSDGKVTAVKAGSATITVTTADGSKTATCTVTVIEETPAYSANITVGSVTARAGDEVTVPITIADNPGIAGFNLTINYDKTLLTPVSIAKGSALTSGTLTSNIQQGGDMSAYEMVTAVWSNAANIANDGEILNVTFAIADDASECDIPVSVTYADGDITNQNYESVSLDVTNGKITVDNVLPGDVYADGVVNIKDSVRLNQYLAKWDITFTSAEKKAADVVKDEAINIKDSVKLNQYLAKWDVTLEEASIFENKQGKIKLEIANVSAKAGDTIEIPVSLTENSGVAGYDFQISYDKTKLTPVSITSKMPDGSLTSNIQQGGDMSAYDAVTAVWSNAANVTYTGEAFVITFAVADDASGEIPITLQNNLSCDQSFNDLEVEIVNGAVAINEASLTDYTVSEITTANNQVMGNVYAEVSVTKNSDREAKDMIIIAVYNDGALVDMTYMKAQFAKGQTVIFGGKVDVPEGAKIKAFVWDGFDTMTALSNTAEL